MKDKLALATALTAGFFAVIHTPAPDWFVILYSGICGSMITKFAIRNEKPDRADHVEGPA